MAFKRKHPHPVTGSMVSGSSVRVSKGHSNIVGVSKASTNYQPPVRDDLNRPLRWNDEISDFEIDIARWVDEVNQKDE